MRKDLSGSMSNFSLRACPSASERGKSVTIHDRIDPFFKKVPFVQVGVGHSLHVKAINLSVNSLNITVVEKSLKSSSVLQLGNLSSEKEEDFLVFSHIFKSEVLKEDMANRFLSHETAIIRIIKLKVNSCGLCAFFNIKDENRRNKARDLDDVMLVLGRHILLCQNENQPEQGLRKLKLIRFWFYLFEGRNEFVMESHCKFESFQAIFDLLLHEFVLNCDHF